MQPIRTAEIISVGTELLLGETVDTNSAFLAGELAAAGIDTYWALRVGDNLERLKLALSGALERSDLVLLTGGLGPTDDDLTREAIAAVMGETPEIDAELEAWLRGRFSSLGREMPERNLKQAWLIPSAEALPNPGGTAPGWLVTHTAGDRTRLIVALPGPPRELYAMWRDHALPRLQLSGSDLYRLTLKTTGIGESHLADLLGDLLNEANPSVATYARADGVHVRVAAKDDSRARAENRAQPVVARLRSLLGDHVWGSDEDELNELIASTLRRRGLTLASAEGPSGGLLMETLAAAPDALSAYRGGVLAWAAQAMGILGMPRPAEQGHSGEELAGLMADAARETFTADFGLATFAWGRAGRPGEQAGVSEVFIALTGGTTPTFRRLEIPASDAAWQRERMTVAALHLTWAYLRRSAPAEQ